VHSLIQSREWQEVTSNARIFGAKESKGLKMRGRRIWRQCLLMPLVLHCFVLACVGSAGDERPLYRYYLESLVVYHSNFQICLSVAHPSCISISSQILSAMAANHLSEFIMQGWSRRHISRFLMPRVF